MHRNENGPALSPGPLSSAPCLCLAARHRHVLTVVVMMVMVAPIVVMMVMVVPANDDRTAMVMMVVVVMILSDLNALGSFGSGPLRAGRVVSVQKRYRIRNGR